MDDWELTVEEKGNDVEAVSVVNTAQQGIIMAIENSLVQQLSIQILFVSVLFYFFLFSR